MPAAAPIIASAALSGLGAGIAAKSVLLGVVFGLGSTGLGAMIDGTLKP